MIWRADARHGCSKQGSMRSITIEVAFEGARTATTSPLSISPDRLTPQTHNRYLLLCRGSIPVAFDLDKVRASVAAAAAANAATAASTKAVDNQDTK